MDNARFYDPHGLPAQELAQVVANWFGQQGYEVRVSPVQGGRTLVEAYKGGTWRSIFGLNLALTTIFTPQPDGKIVVELGGESWGDKIVSGAVGFVLLPPLLFTAAVGAWQQSELDEKVWQLIGDHIFARTNQSPNTIPAVPYYPNPPAYAPQPQGYQPADYSGYYSMGYAPAGQQPPPPQQWPSAGSWPTASSSTATATPTTKNSWFDPETTQSIFSIGFTKMATWQKAMADGVIEASEVDEQSRLVSDLEQRARAKLDPSQQAKLDEVLAAMDKLERLESSSVS